MYLSDRVSRFLINVLDQNESHYSVTGQLGHP